MQWIVVNLFLLFLILVGAGVFWLLGAGIKMLGLDEEIERYPLFLAAVAAIFASYYAGKFLHWLASRR